MILEICGFLKNSFKLKNSWILNEFFGTITDGQYKLNVSLKSDKEYVSNIKLGSKLEIIGEIQEEG